MDVHGVNRGFLGLLLTFFILGFPAELHAEEIAGEGDLRHKSSTQILLRRLRGTDLENPGDRFDEDYNIWLQAEHLKTASVWQQLGGTDIERKKLQLFLDERAGVNIVKQIQNTGSSFGHNLRNIVNNQPPRTNSFLHGSLYRHRALAPFVSSVVIPTYDDDAEFVRPASGEDQNSNLPWPLEGLRALLDLHTHEKRLLLSPLGTPAISPVSAIAPSPSVQNNHDKVPVPSPEILLSNFGPSPLTGVVVQPDQNLFIPPPEQLKKSGNSKTVILAVVITAISTLLLSGLFFYCYQRCFSNRHGSNHHNDQRPLLLASVHSESLNQYYGEPQGFNWATFENSNGISPKSAFLETGKADVKQLSSFNRRNLRVLSLPSCLRKSTEALDIHPFPPLAKTKPSLELCDKGAFNSSTSKTHVGSTQPLPESLQASSSIPASLSANSSVPSHAWNKTPSQPTHVSLPRHSQSSHPLSLSSKLPPFLPQPNSSVCPPVNLTPTSPPVSSSPTPPSLSKPTPPPPPPTGKSPPPPPPPPPGKFPPPPIPPPPPPTGKSPPPPPPPTGKSPPPPPPPGKFSHPPLPLGKSPPPPPPPMGKSPPLPPPAPANGKSNGPKVPLPPGRSSQIPPLMPSRSKGQPENSNVVGEDGNQRPKLKPFHWDKVQANPDHSMVWDQIRAGSFQFNEEMIETLFGYNSSNTATSRMAKQANNPSQNKQLLDPKKSQNLAILLRAMNLRREDVCDALLNGESLSVELLETLIKMAPTRDEEKKLKEYNDDISKLGPAERFLKALLEIPSAFERMDKMLYRENFKDEIRYIRKSFEALEAACKVLRSSRLFLKLLEAVLKTGNRMNVGTMRGGAQAFKLDTLLKLSDVKGTDGKTTLLHFVVQEIIRAEGVRAAHMAQQSSSDTIGKKMSSENEEDYYRTLGLQVLINLSNDLYNVKNAATIDSDALISSLAKLVMGLNKLRSFLQKEFGSQPTEASRQQGNFCQSMTLFLHQAEEEISQIQSEEKRVFLLVKDLTKYFHGDAAKEEAHPLRIFVIVRDFTHMLDQVCKEVGKMQKQKPPNSSQKGSSSISVQNVPRSLFPVAFERNADSSDDSSE